MPRPQHLGNLASALPYSDDNGLTPRTPHSRTARLEGGFAKLQVGEVDDFEMSTFAQQQSAPLLHSSTSSRFAGRPQSSRHATVESREPLSRTSRALAAFGVVLAGVLLVLIIVSYTNQPLLMRTFGLDRANLHPSTSSHGGLSYQNYTSFPLLGTQYLHECAKQMSGFMSHGDYWDAPRHHGAPMDADHANDPHNRICNSTITYLLDGKVGLAADLGLMAQAAALAQEVRAPVICLLLTFKVQPYSETGHSSLTTPIGREGSGPSTSRMSHRFNEGQSRGAYPHPLRSSLHAPGLRGKYLIHGVADGCR